MKKLTKKARKEMAQAAIDATPIGEHFDLVNLAALNEACGTQWPDAKHMLNPSFPDPRHVHVLDDDGWRSWSWNKAISPRSSDSLVREVLRAEIQPDMDDYASANEEEPCAWRHKSACNGDMCTDHHIIPFVDIAKEFMGLYESIEIEDVTSGGVKRIKDEKIAAHWIEFHAQKATYQRLCRTHNSQKGSRGEQ